MVEKPPHVAKYVWDRFAILKRPSPIKVERPKAVVQPEGMSFRTLLRSFKDSTIIDLGGPGSGNFGHEGRPGHIGGSGGDDGGGDRGAGKADSIPAGNEGECFRNAASWVRIHDDFDLVHGKVTNGEGRTFDHAWAETKAVVADPTTGVRMAKDTWYDLVKAKPEARYSAEQASINMIRTRNLGPWTDEEVGNRKLDLGGAGSGNFGHVGRVGQVGGSASSNDNLIETKHGKFRDADHERDYLAQQANNKKTAQRDALADELLPGGRFETAEQRRQATIAVTERLVQFATGTGPEGYKPVFIMGAEPNLIRTGEQMVSVLEEMKAKGLEMPNVILIRHTDQEFVHAAIRGTRMEDAATGKVSFKKDLEVEIPRSLPSDVSLDDAVEATFSGTVSSKDSRLAQTIGETSVSPKDEKWIEEKGDPKYTTYDKYTARTLKDVIIHEMGHVQAGHRTQPIDVKGLLDKKVFPAPLAVRAAMLRVSVYGAMNVNEFLAESFTRLYRGEKLDDLSMTLYKSLDGPATDKRGAS